MFLIRQVFHLKILIKKKSSILKNNKNLEEIIIANLSLKQYNNFSILFSESFSKIKQLKILTLKRIKCMDSFGISGYVILKVLFFSKYLNFFNISHISIIDDIHFTNYESKDLELPELKILIANYCFLSRPSYCYDTLVYDIKEFFGYIKLSSDVNILYAN